MTFRKGDAITKVPSTRLNSDQPLDPVLVSFLFAHPRVMGAVKLARDTEWIR